MRIKQDWTTDHRHWYRTVYLESQHWKELRKRKLDLSPKCERCGASKELDVHHVNYRNLFDVELPDLLTLCRACHSREHAEHGMPRRKKISYKNYFPKPAIRAIRLQRKQNPKTPYFNFKSKGGRIAFSVWSGRTEWREDLQNRFGIPNPATTDKKWWFSSEAYFRWKNMPTEKRTKLLHGRVIPV